MLIASIHSPVLKYWSICLSVCLSASGKPRISRLCTIPNELESGSGLTPLTSLEQKGNGGEGERSVVIPARKTQKMIAASHTPQSQLPHCWVCWPKCECVCVRLHNATLPSASPSIFACTYGVGKEERAHTLAMHVHSLGLACFATEVSLGVGSR